LKSFIKTIAITLPMIWVMQSCGNSTAESKSMEQLHRENGLPVKTSTVQAQPISSTYTTHAVLSGIQESTAHAAVADRVDHILLRVGETVKKDDVILTFPTDNPAAQYMQARVNVEHSRTTTARMKALYESGGISRQEYDNVAAQCRVAEANFDAVQQSVKVRAPISGVLTRLDIQESDNVNPGDPLFTIARTEQLKAQLWVAENQISEIKKGNAARAMWNGHTITGCVSQVDLSLNTAMQAFGVQVEFDNSQAVLRSGVNAEVQLYSENSEAAVITARKNLIKKGGQYFVYKLIDDKAVKHPVTTGRQLDLDIEIIDGLASGDIIITQGLTLVEDGQLVRVLN